MVYTNFNFFHTLLEITHIGVDTMINPIDNYEDHLICNQDVIKLFQKAARTNTPLSLARFGHAEISVAFHPHTDWIKGWEYRDYVGVTGSPKEIQRELREAIKLADIIGLHTSYSTDEADKRSAKEAQALLNQMNIKPKVVCDAWITHCIIYEKLFWDFLRELKVVLIGRRSKEAETYFLEKGVTVVATYGLEGYSEITTVCNQLCKKSDWQLALISAGIPASILAPKLARSSGRIAIDFGHAIDKIIEGERFNHNRIAEEYISRNLEK